ncbi:MAG: hypothetical protein CVV56_00775 [Tenericutes bacterium HGW-Tenericutes-1]|jgi:predicted Zn-dependent peptidase|nr:MAG: hypothetical protein CVV56_00775 [Tenericutes bacterium HGW-Tenericutes-1]
MFKIDLLPTKKFKSTLITVRLIAPFNQESLNYRAILPQVLASSTKKYRSKAGMTRRLDYLYGTQMSVFTSKLGFESIIHFQVQFPSDRFLPNQESLSEEVIELIKQIIFHPLTKNGVFSKNVVNDEIRLVKEALEAEYNDKGDYAFQQFKKIMFENELYALRSKGDYETLDLVTPETLWNAYLAMLKNDSFHISVVGDFNELKIKKLLLKTFDFQWKERPHQWVDTETKLISQVARVPELNDVKQAKLFLGFRSEIRIDSKDYLAMSVFNTLFGDSDQAKLFRTIREEQHLCYYVSSSYDSNKGVVFISMGVEPGNEDLASRLAIETLEKIKSGEFSEEDLAFAKSFQIKRIRQRDDSILTLSAMDFYFRNLYGVSYDTLQLVQSIDSLSKEDIMKCANSLILDTYYYLTRRND